MTSKPDASGFGVAVLVGCAAILISFLLVALLKDNGPSDAQTARRACQYHHGVRSIDFSYGIVCLDGYVADP